MNTVIVAVVFLVASVQGAEWMTSGSHHCIERCHTGTRKGLDAVLWCRVVDGVSKEHRPAGAESGRPSVHEEEDLTEEDKYAWDYCTPATVDALEGGEVFEEGVEAVVLPERVDRSKRQTGGFNPGTIERQTASSLAGINCLGECTENFGGSYNCDVPGDNPNNFFCSPHVPLKRQQLTSHNKLWCISDCVKGSSEDNYECRTLYGYDRCSPAGDRSSSGAACTSQCQASTDSDHRHYQCYTDQRNEQREDCGYWYVAGAQKEALEYTDNDQVCAGPCQEVDGDQVCSYVDWEWNEAGQVASLEMSLGFCGHQKKMSWATIGIIIGCIVGAVLVIGLVAFFVSRRKYSQASTRDY
eukprot:TRINITY_DN5856_c0_g1_i4.p1 TRINITY_DN5856_c0_g1~~TRINITY_DN5856_c0_g1_i4.p1  ORF type:complete len:355 (-),score=95.08 TRINITY_DN5856_c0_g1_i4:79-1143(-)